MGQRRPNCSQTSHILEQQMLPFFLLNFIFSWKKKITAKMGPDLPRSPLFYKHTMQKLIRSSQKLPLALKFYYSIIITTGFMSYFY